MKKNKQEETKPLYLPFSTKDFGELVFEVECDKEVIDWNFDKKGRKLEISLMLSLEETSYKELHNKWFGVNIVENELLPNIDAVKGLLTKIKQNFLMFDFIIIELSVMCEDENENYYGEFSYYSGIGLTVNGRKQITEYEKGNFNNG